MTVTLQTTISRYIGLAADTKPTGVPVGSEFLEYDTGAVYVTHDGTLWVLKVAPPGSTGDGIVTTPTPTFLAVTATTQLALAANAAALTRLFINDGALPIYLAKGVAAVANRGIRLNANGGWHSMSQKLDNMYRGAVNAISTAAGPTNLLIEEGV